MKDLVWNDPWFLEWEKNQIREVRVTPLTYWGHPSIQFSALAGPSHGNRRGSVYPGWMFSLKPVDDPGGSFSARLSERTEEELRDAQL